MNVRRSIRVDVSDLMGGLDKFGKRAHSRVEKSLDESREQLRAYMKQNHKWQNQTGNAERGLDAKVENPKEGYYRIALSHGVYYGVYLENAFEGRYAILTETMLTKGPEVLENLRGILN